MQIQIPHMAGSALLLFARAPEPEARAKAIGVTPQDTHTVFLGSVCRAIGVVDEHVDIVLPSDHVDGLRSIVRDTVGTGRRIVTVGVRGDGFGRRLFHALAASFERGYAHVVVVVGDCPELRPRHLMRALAFLQDGVPSVVGPSPDGGAYLLGLSRLPKKLFDGVTFCGGSTRAELVRSLTAHGLPPLLLESVADIDSDDELWRLRQRLQRLVPGSRLAADVSRLVTTSPTERTPAPARGSEDTVAGAPVRSSEFSRKARRLSR